MKIMNMWSYSPSCDPDIKIEENEIKIKSEYDQLEELEHIVKTEIDAELESYKEEENEVVNNGDIELKFEETEQESSEHQSELEEYDFEENPKIHTDSVFDSENRISVPNSSQYTWQCRVCNVKFNNKGDLTEHITRTHRDASNFNLFKCDICGYTTKYLHKLVFHKPCHKSHPEPPPKLIVEPKKVQRIEIRKCDLCDFTSVDENGLGEHVTATHKDPSNTNMFKCSSCSYVTEYFHRLKMHKPRHDRIKMHHCDKCSFKTKFKPNLRQHVVAKHINSVKHLYSCEKCTFESASRHSLRRHLLRHDEKYYECKVCGYQTKTNSQMKRHVVRHMKLEEVKAYKCEMCKFRTKWKASLNKHVLRHAKNSA